MSYTFVTYTDTNRQYPAVLSLLNVSVWVEVPLWHIRRYVGPSGKLLRNVMRRPSSSVHVEKKMSS